MITQLNLKNFRCFNEYEILFDQFNVIVGKNNTGKSTIIDALKLISNIRRYASYRKYFSIELPEYLPYGVVDACYIENRDIPFSQINVRFNYSHDDAIISSKFADNSEIYAVFPDDGRPYAFLVKDGMSVSNKQQMKEYFGHSIGIIPPVSTFEEIEPIGNRKYTGEVMVSHLTGRHFRNIWHYFPENFEEFKTIIETTWPGHTIELPERDLSINQVLMFFRENNITREIYWAGHGFQVWLQLMTALVKLGHMDTLILDEPDIYLHSDLQKKLINLCKSQSNQVIIATHAVDIIEESDPEDIISIDKNTSKAYRLSNVDEVQTCISQLGSYQNLKLIHFIKGKSCLFVEGNDFYLLKLFAKKLKNQTIIKEDGFSVIPLEGFSNWDRLLHISWIFKNAFGERVKCYVILDRDYYSEQEIQEMENDLDRKGVKVHVWNKKEIENYMINVDVLYRIFSEKFYQKYSRKKPLIQKNEFKNDMMSLFDEFKNHVASQIIAHRIKNKIDRSIDDSTIISKILKDFNENWKDFEYREKIIPGKDFFAKMNNWLAERYQFTISKSILINSFEPEEINPEVKLVLSEFTELVHSN